MDVYALMLIAGLVSHHMLEKNSQLNIFPKLSHPIDKAIGFSFTITFIFVFSSGLIYPLYKYLLFHPELKFLRIILIFIIVEITTRAIYLFMQNIFSSASKESSPFPPLVLVNCAILGSILLNLSNNLNFLTHITYSLLGALGFSIFLIMFAAVKESTAHSDIPIPFRGLAIDFITIGVVAIGCTGFLGLVN